MSDELALTHAEIHCLWLAVVQSGDDYGVDEDNQIRALEILYRLHGSPIDDCPFERARKRVVRNEYAAARAFSELRCINTTIEHVGEPAKFGAGTMVWVRPANMAGIRVGDVLKVATERGPCELGVFAANAIMFLTRPSAELVEGAPLVGPFPGDAETAGTG